MTRAEKITKRKERAARRIAKRAKVWNEIVNVAQFNDVPISAARCKVKHGYYKEWADSNSPTGYSQVCSYQGICQSPCNGDC